MEIVISIIVILLIIAAIILAYFPNIFHRKSSHGKISFRETMDLVGLPIITLRQGDSVFNFILDTGAFSSLIDSRALNRLQYTEIEGTAIGYGIDGKEHSMSKIGAVFTYKEQEYSEVFRVLDMTASFGSLKRDYGVTVHGLLSSSFFERYKYVLNYNEYIAYPMV